MVQVTSRRKGSDSAASSSLSASAYTSLDQVKREWEQVWSRCWMFAGLARDALDPGDYFVYEIGRESVIVVRDNEYKLRAFYNVCQHRGNRLLANTSGFVQSFSCPYHGWRYTLEGTLDFVPDADRFDPAPDAQWQSLKPVQLACWAGMVWINLDAEARPLEHYLGDVVSELDGYHFENMVLAEHQTVSLRANWKTVRDNFLEQYHVDFIHPQHASMVDCSNSTNILYPGGHSSTQVAGFVTNSRYPLPDITPEFLRPILDALGLDASAFNGRVSEIRETVQRRKRELAAGLTFDASDLSDEQLSDVWQYDIFPNIFMTIQAEELWIYGPRPHPTDPDRCLFDKWTLRVSLEDGVDSGTGARLSPQLSVSRDDPRPPHDCFDHDAVIRGEKSLTITIDQDIEYLGDMQRGLHSAGFDRAFINQDEVRLQHFHDWLEFYLQHP